MIYISLDELLPTVEVNNHGGRPYIVPIRPANSSE